MKLNIEQTFEKITLAEWTKNTRASAMQNSLLLAKDSEFISFALGLPDTSLFPSGIKKMVQQIFLDKNKLQYAPPIQKLKQQIVKIMSLRGVNCCENEIFLTAGAQQGISLLVKLLINKNTKVILENFTYPGLLQAIEPYKADLITVDTHFEDGIKTDEIETWLKKNNTAAFIYVVTDGGNPHATSISLENRQKLASTAKKYSIPIIEDDPYGFLNYEDVLNPPIKSMEPNWVIYIGSFSKILAPSFRVGWLVAPLYLHPFLSILKEGADINTVTFSQQLVSQILDAISIEKHIHKLNHNYKNKRDFMYNALKKYFPEPTIVRKPKSGLFFWLELPKNININKLFDLALKKYKVAFIPGELFSVTKNAIAKNYIRLSFSAVKVGEINKGIQRLGEAINELMA